jgi:hypothetical protein
MKEIIGLTVADARKYHKNIRVVEENGARVPVSKEHRPDRVNVAIKNGKIVRILGMG